jgi:hypothetical protein
MNQTLLHKVAKALDKEPNYIRQQVSRRAGREGVVSDVALINWARELNLGVTNAVNHLEPHHLQQLSAPRVPPRARAPAAKSEKVQPRKPPRRKKGLLVFISHSGADRKIAERIVELLRDALNIEAGKIRCTSVEGHRLEAGVGTDETLRAEVRDCEVLVGLISPTSRRSTYVLLELGARWGAGGPLIPLTISGVTPGELEGPIGGKNALNCSIKAQVLQFVGDMSTKLGRATERPEVFVKRVDAVVRASKKKPPKKKAK